MKKKLWIFVTFIIFSIAFTITFMFLRDEGHEVMQKIQSNEEQGTSIDVTPSTKITNLEDGMSVIRYDGDYGFQDLLDAKGASSDEEVLTYLMDNVLTDVSGLQILKNVFGCSTIQTKNNEQDVLFGRNFDWKKSEALIIQSNPDHAYESIASVNLDFIQIGTSLPIRSLPDDVLARVAMYAPLDGMNEKGLAISVNMIEDTDVIQQAGKSQNLTTTTAIRVILNKAADVDEAIALLKQYNLHSSMGLMIHFAIADAKGNSVVVEYVNNEMNVVETPVVTNFYLSEGVKAGMGSSQSHERYEVLMETLKENENMDMMQVKDALDHVSKDNFGEFESTEWSIVYNLKQKEIHYYHRENYDKRYIFRFDK